MTRPISGVDASTNFGRDFSFNWSERRLNPESFLRQYFQYIAVSKSLDIWNPGLDYLET
jgi:hypothetical protein